MEEDWVQYTDDSGVPYWYNGTTGESSYEAPEGAQPSGSGGAMGSADADWTSGGGADENYASDAYASPDGE